MEMRQKWEKSVISEERPRRRYIVSESFKTILLRHMEEKRLKSNVDIHNHDNAEEADNE